MVRIWLHSVCCFFGARCCSPNPFIHLNPLYASFFPFKSDCVRLYFPRMMHAVWIFVNIVYISISALWKYTHWIIVMRLMWQHTSMRQLKMSYRQLQLAEAIDTHLFRNLIHLHITTMQITLSIYSLNSQVRASSDSLNADHAKFLTPNLW